MFQPSIAARAALTPGATALLTLKGGRTYAEMDGDIRRCTHRLAELALPRGAVVVVDTPSLYMHWCLAFALEALGLVTCAPPPGGATEAFVAMVKPAFLISSSTAPLPAAVQGLRMDAAFVDDLARRPLAEPPPLARNPDDPLFLLVTSGTTGEAKQVLLTRGQITLRMQHADGRISGVPTSETPRMMCTVGPFSFAGVLFALRSWGRGGVLCSPDPGAGWLELLDAYALTSLALPPVLLQALIATLDGRRLDPSPRISVIGGTPSPELAEAARAAFAGDVVVGYGSTEAGAVAGGHISLLHGDAAVAGRILPWAEVEVRDEEGRVLAPGEVGELRVRAEGMARGYADRPQGDPAFRDGWFHPGDLASIDAERILRIHGRVNEVMNLGGAKVLPAWLEEVAERFPGLGECAAFAAPDAVGLDAPFLAFNGDAALDEAGLARALAERLQRPVGLVRVDRLPRNALGKVERRRLREAMIAAGAATA